MLQTAGVKLVVGSAWLQATAPNAAGPPNEMAEAAMFFHVLPCCGICAQTRACSFFGGRIAMGPARGAHQISDHVL